MIAIVDAMLYRFDNIEALTIYKELQSGGDHKVFFEQLPQIAVDEEQGDIIAFSNLCLCAATLVLALVTWLSRPKVDEREWNIDNIKRIVEEKMLAIGVSDFKITKIEDLEGLRKGAKRTCKIEVETKANIYQIYIYRKDDLIALSPRPINIKYF